MKAVFDTNILIDYLIGNLLAKKEIEQYQSPQISIITKMEILVGVTDNEEIIKEFLNGFNIIPLNDEIAEIAVNIRKENKIKYLAHQKEKKKHQAPVFVHDLQQEWQMKRFTAFYKGFFFLQNSLFLRSM